MKKKKKKLFIAVALVLAVYLIYRGYERWPSQNWKEYRSLVGIWPRLKKEKIESIIFCTSLSDENKSFFQELVTTFSFRVIDANVVKSWSSGYEVGKDRICCPDLADTFGFFSDKAAGNKRSIFFGWRMITENRPGLPNIFSFVNAGQKIIWEALGEGRTIQQALERTDGANIYITQTDRLLEL